MATRTILPDRYTCKCGKVHVYPTWVYAHWDLELRHTCDGCGRVNILHKGKVTHGICETKDKD